MYLIQEWKLDVMTKEVIKLRKVLDEFKKDRCRISLAEEIYKSMNPVSLYRLLKYYNRSNFFSLEV